MKKFTIKNGTDICSIGMSNVGSYIRFNEPLTMVWHDCQGSVGKYFCALPYNEERPFCIIFTASSSFARAAYYILDGHHKLLAYQNLNIYPPLALITHLPNNTNETEFNIKQLKDFLFPWQIKHISGHWQR